MIFEDKTFYIMKFVYISRGRVCILLVLLLRLLLLVAYNNTYIHITCDDECWVGQDMTRQEEK